MDIQKDAFKEEAFDLLAELETSLLELESAPGDEDLVSRVFRALHTIKGSGAMFGFDDIAGFTHEVETVFDMVRKGTLPASGDLIDLVLRARDRIRSMLETGEPYAGPDKDDVILGLKALAAGEPVVSGESGGAVAAGPASPAEGMEPPAAPQAEKEPETTFRIRFAPHPDIFDEGSDPLELLDELRGLGMCDVVARTENIPGLEALDPKKCHTSFDIILTTDKGENAIRDVFIFVEDRSEIKIDAILTESGDTEEEDHKRLGEILIEKGDITSEALKAALSEQKKIGEHLVEAAAVDKESVASALAEQQHIRKVRESRTEAARSSSIRVAAEKLDTLVNLVGEMVTVQARLSQKASEMRDPELSAISEVVERLTAELRDSAMSVRMLPIGTTFNTFRRLVRDLSADLGKEVEMKTVGGDTELDKTVIERLNDPLVHIIRNSIDHGIETPEDREAAGKPRKGSILLSAEHSGASVLIRITDDGKGLDVEAIRKKALSQGLIAAEDVLTDTETFNLIFLPGFSTARTISGVSGRGVGMDVVKRAIEELRGSIEVTSKKGRGSTIILKLPLTLAIIDGLLVKVGDGNFIVPLSVVEECVEMTRSESDRAKKRSIMDFRGQAVPFFRLRDLFAMAGDPPPAEQVVIAETGEARVGFGVDHVIGQRQTVIKSLGRVYKDVEGISGATILGDGTVALILDAPKLGNN